MLKQEIVFINKCIIGHLKLDILIFIQATEIQFLFLVFYRHSHIPNYDSSQKAKRITYKV